MWLNLLDSSVHSSWTSSCGLTNIAFCPQYRTLGVGHTNGTIILLNLDNQALPQKNQQGEFQQQEIMGFHVGKLTGMDTLAYQHHLATCGSEGSLRFWNFEEADLSKSFLSKLEFDGSLSCVGC